MTIDAGADPAYAAGMLRDAVANARAEHAERGSISETTWRAIDLACRMLDRELAAAEREEKVRRWEANARRSSRVIAG